MIRITLAPVQLVRFNGITGLNSYRALVYVLGEVPIIGGNALLQFYPRNQPASPLQAVSPKRTSPELRRLFFVSRHHSKAPSPTPFRTLRAIERVSYRPLRERRKRPLSVGAHGGTIRNQPPRTLATALGTFTTRRVGQCDLSDLRCRGPL
jgi:hypothetical protein